MDSNTHRKRTYSPKIDEVRQFNIKKFKLLDDLSNLSLQTSNGNSSSDLNNIPFTQKDNNVQMNGDINLDDMGQPRPTHIEYIPNIEEFLLHNQSDQDVIDSTSELLLDEPKLDVLDSIKSDSNWDVGFLDWIDMKRQNMAHQRRFGSWNVHDDDMSLIDVDGYGLRSNDIDYRELMKEYYYKRNKYDIVKYKDPKELVRLVWERWYFQEVKLRQFDNEFMVDDENNDNDKYNDNEMIKEVEMDDDDDDDGKMNYLPIKNTYGGYYHDEMHNDEETSQEMMDLD